jgi:hypothetical protein
MSLAKHAKRRDANEQLIVDALQLRGAHVDKLDRPVDLLIGYEGVTVLAEVKGPKAAVKGKQLTWLSTWRGGRRCVLRATTEALALLDEIEAEVKG